MDKNIDPKTAWWQSGMEIFLRMSGWIGGPVIIGTVVGKYLDRKFNTSPWLFLLSVGVSFIVSMAMIVKIGMGEMKKIEKEAEDIKSKK